jgi:hypothetical protein
MKHTFINEMADICVPVGADVHDVARGIGLDGRIGRKFLHPGRALAALASQRTPWPWCALRKSTVRRRQGRRSMPEQRQQAAKSFFSMMSTFTCRRCSRKKTILHYPYLYLYRKPLLSPLTNCSPAFSPYGPIRLCIVAGGTCFALAFATLAMFFGFRAASRLHPGIRSLAFTILFLPGTVVFSERCM